MRLRIFLLALGFAARTPFEDAAQKAMHRFHRVIFPSLVLDFLILETLFVLCAAIPVFWVGGSERLLFSSVTIAALLGACIFFGAVAGRLWWREGDESFRKHLILHEECSREVAVLCRGVGLPVVRVFLAKELHLEANAAAVALVTGERGIVITGGVLLLAPEERRGIFGHELAHFLIPFGHEQPLFFKKRAHHACEFAADAIGASILNDDPLPIIVFLGHRILRSFHLNSTAPIDEDSTTHPALLERLDQLLNMYLLSSAKSNTTRR